jgi:hypothetical protein
VSATGESIAYGRDIKQLYSEGDRETKLSVFVLWSYDDVSRVSDAILARLRDGSMPCDGAWPEERIALFEDWVGAGKPA